MITTLTITHDDDAVSSDYLADTMLEVEGVVAVQITTVEERETETHACKHCGHGILLVDGTWVAPDAGFDRESGDGIWRDSCPDNHESREAPHEPDYGLEDDLRLLRKNEG